MARILLKIILSLELWLKHLLLINSMQNFSRTQPNVNFTLEELERIKSCVPCIEIFTELNTKTLHANIFAIILKQHYEKFNGTISNASSGKRYLLNAGAHVGQDNKNSEKLLHTYRYHLKKC